MNRLLLLLGILFTLAIFPAPVKAQSPADPPELIEQREKLRAAMNRATLSLITGYVKTLVLLEDRFMNERNLPAAMAVDNEINSAMAALQGSALQDRAGHRFPVIVIISAQYREVANHAHTVDITEHVRKVFASGAPTLRLNTREGAEGKDPAFNEKKETVIDYTSDGQQREIILPEAATLNFRRDLR